MAEQFVLLRLTRMRGIDLDLFEFDYDLTWAAFFLNADEKIYGRYGGRDAESADSRTSLAGLRYAMEAALAAHRRGGKTAAPKTIKPPRTVNDFAAARRLSDKACIHCHQVYDFRREELQASGKWRLDEVWVYPLPENVGLTLEVNRGDRVAKVLPDSPAARLGIHSGDRLRTVNGQPIASFADVQHALHRAPAKGEIPLAWESEGKAKTGNLALAEGWRKTDVSWRWSLRGLDPPPWVQGLDLNADEKRALGLGAKQLAFRQGPFVTEPARQAGIQQGDVILGVGGKTLEMTAREFAAHVRLTYKVGDRVTYNVLRDGKRIEVPLTLIGRK